MDILSHLKLTIAVFGLYWEYIQIWTVQSKFQAKKNVVVKFVGISNLLSFSDFHALFYRDQRYPGDGYGHPFPFMH